MDVLGSLAEERFANWKGSPFEIMTSGTSSTEPVNSKTGSIFPNPIDELKIQLLGFHSVGSKMPETMVSAIANSVENSTLKVKLVGFIVVVNKKCRLPYQPTKDAAAIKPPLYSCPQGEP